MAFGFIILRHMNNEITSKYWKASYNSIRKHYPEQLIVIIDDNSNEKYFDKNYEKSLYNTKIINSDFKKRGELLPYYYLLKYKFFGTAIILHDSAFLNSRINLRYSKYKKFWDFEHEWNDEKNEKRLIKQLDNNRDILKLHKNKNNWKGCFGCMMIISYKYLKEIDNKHNIKKLVNHIHNREDRMSFERVISCILGSGHMNESLYGDFLKYWKDDYGKSEFEDINNKKLPILKIWTGR